MAGGGVVILGMYTWYHFSGAKKAVEASKAAQQYYQQAKEVIVEKAPKNPNEMIQFLRSTAKSYTGLIPGASSYIDKSFDTLDELHKTHGEEMDKILQSAYDEIKRILDEKDSGMNMETGMKVAEVLRRRMGELQEVGKSAGQDVFKALGDQYPEITEKLGGGYENLKAMAEKSGPEAKKILDDTTQQVKDMFTKGFSLDRLNEARELIQTKTAEVRKLAESSSQDAWDKAVQQASPYLDKLPEIKKLIDENASKFMVAGAAQGAAAQEVFTKVREAAEEGVAGNKQKMKELQDFIVKKAKEAQEKGSGGIEKGWQTLKEWIKTMPGGEEALKKVPDMEALVKLTQEGDDKAKKLAQETYEEILKVLQEKGNKAKDLSGKMKEDEKKNTS
ncbi:hypothetical protein AcV5_007291 [Taiwanofungus camphoratus]|nr:hypothetical protein AcV5_007291 [Antrodia cinnamomea]KAI0958432.1 hypothetical protein AcV7_004258 [Antrodia cinnamomea]